MSRVASTAPRNTARLTRWMSVICFDVTTPGDVDGRICQRGIVGEVAVTGIGAHLGDRRDCRGDRDGRWDQCAAGRDANEAGLGHRSRRPVVLGSAGEPRMGSFVMDVLRPTQSDQDVDVE